MCIKVIWFRRAWCERLRCRLAEGPFRSDSFLRLSLLFVALVKWVGRYDAPTTWTLCYSRSRARTDSRLERFFRRRSQSGWLWNYLGGTWGFVIFAWISLISSGDGNELCCTSCLWLVFLVIKYPLLLEVWILKMFLDCEFMLGKRDALTCTPFTPDFISCEGYLRYSITDESGLEDLILLSRLGICNGNVTAVQIHDY